MEALPQAEASHWVESLVRVLRAKCAGSARVLAKLLDLPRAGLWAYALGAALLGLLVISDAAFAATIAVNSLADTGAPGTCILRDAITAANTMAAVNGCAGGTGNDTIQFSVTGTITLASSLPTITATLTISGPPGSPRITIDGNSPPGPFDFFTAMQIASGANAKLTNLTLTHIHGNAGAIDNEGTLNVANCTLVDNGKFGDTVGPGGILNGGTLMLTNSVLLRNGGGGDGAISNGGTSTITNSTFSDNNAGGENGNGGGAIGNSGILNVINCTFSGNTAAEEGGAIRNFSGTTVVTGSTFVQNIALSGPGGAIRSESGSATVVNSTFSGNSGFEGGGIETFAPFAVVNGTFSGNTAPQIRSDGVGVATVHGSILAGTTGGNCVGSVTDAGYNLSDDSTCGFAKTGSANNGDNVDPLLSPAGLADNGGPTQTIALLEASPAVDAIPLANCIDQSTPPKPIITDQREFPRPDTGEQVCDIGAYEFQDAPAFAGQPGKPNCHGKSVSSLNHEFGSLGAAAPALGFSSVKALQNAIKTFCK